MAKQNKNISVYTRSLDDSTPFAVKEAFSQLRTNLLYTPHSGEGCPVYAVTSAEENVGKSTISANVAIAFSQINKRVLLIDADMRRPAVHSFFGYDKKQTGLSELLSEIVTSDTDAISSPLPNLSVITSGCIPPNPAELISSQNFLDLINKWKLEYDVIFIDMPPTGIVTDPLIIASAVTGYLLIAMENRSDSKKLSAVASSIEQVGGKIVGAVLNATSSKSGKAYKYTSKKYQSYNSYY